jgi:hypothetical protein
MATDCIAQVTFEFDSKRKPVVAVFDAEHASSDSGAILLKGIVKLAPEAKYSDSQLR